MKETHTCQYCEAELETTASGLAGHQKRCRKARPWQRAFFLERGKWPDRKVNKTSFTAGGGHSRRGRSPGADPYDA